MAAKAISSRRVLRRCVRTPRYTCVSSRPPEIMQASNNEQIEPTHTHTQGQAQRQGSRGVFAVGGSRKQIMINWLTFYKTLALMHLGRPCPLARRRSYFNSSGEPFVIYENQAVALIAQLRSGSSVVAAGGGEAGAQ